jgi:hypothetical protein
MAIIISQNSQIPLLLVLEIFYFNIFAIKIASPVN